MMIGNAVYGLGEQLVSGEVNPLSFTLQRPKGAYDAYDGPADTSCVSTSLQPFARQLYRLGERLEEALDGAQDIEWAIADGKLYLLQSRPITTLQAHNPATGEWNDSYLGDYLWTNTNFGEALPDVMTPFTWSIMQVYLKNNALGIESESFPLGGNIGGRLYMNVSLFVSLIEGLGLPRQKMLRLVREMFGHLPPDMKIPTVPFARWRLLRTLAPQLWRRFWLVKQQKKRVPAFIASTPAVVTELFAQVEAAQSKAELLALWESRLQAHLDEACQMLAAGTSDYKNLSRQLHIELERLVGEADANALLSGVSSEDDYLASLGPLLGLTKVAQGEMSRAEYIQHYGHRGAHELELSKPRPAEEAHWLEQKLTEIKQNKTDARALLAKQRKQQQSAWERFKVQYPHKANSLKQRLKRMAEASKSREATRSEVVRIFGIFRAFALRVGALTGFRDTAPVFFLSLHEQLALLAGDESSTAFIPARQQTYARYSALPPYPSLIKGRFDPFQWAADPQRRHDIFDAHLSNAERGGQEESAKTIITGFAGAAGIVEGTVCILHSVEEGHKLYQTATSDKAILVTTTTNIGWTPLFPRAAAIITDVGAPLSHAAIVARELGIPAVVGCGNATMLLKDGDRVRVNGGAGIVEKL